MGTVGGVKGEDGGPRWRGSSDEIAGREEAAGVRAAEVLALVKAVRRGSGGSGGRRPGGEGSGDGGNEGDRTRQRQSSSGTPHVTRANRDARTAHATEQHLSHSPHITRDNAQSHATLTGHDESFLVHADSLDVSFLAHSDSLSIAHSSPTNALRIPSPISPPLSPSIANHPPLSLLSHSLSHISMSEEDKDEVSARIALQRELADLSRPFPSPNSPALSLPPSASIAISNPVPASTPPHRPTQSTAPRLSRTPSTTSSTPHRPPSMPLPIPSSLNERSRGEKSHKTSAEPQWREPRDQSEPRYNESPRGGRRAEDILESWASEDRVERQYKGTGGTRNDDGAPSEPWNDGDTGYRTTRGAPASTSAHSLPRPPAGKPTPVPAPVRRATSVTAAASASGRPLGGLSNPPAGAPYVRDVTLQHPATHAGTPPMPAWSLPPSRPGPSRDARDPPPYGGSREARDLSETTDTPRSRPGSTPRGKQGQQRRPDSAVWLSQRSLDSGGAGSTGAAAVENPSLTELIKDQTNGSTRPREGERVVTGGTDWAGMMGTDRASRANDSTPQSTGDSHHHSNPTPRSRPSATGSTATFAYAPAAYSPPLAVPIPPNAQRLSTADSSSILSFSLPPTPALASARPGHLDRALSPPDTPTLARMLVRGDYAGVEGVLGGWGGERGRSGERGRTRVGEGAGRLRGLPEDGEGRAILSHLRLLHRRLRSLSRSKRDLSSAVTSAHAEAASARARGDALARELGDARGELGRVRDAMDGERRAWQEEREDWEAERRKLKREVEEARKEAERETRKREERGRGVDRGCQVGGEDVVGEEEKREWLRERGGERFWCPSEIENF
ncbi:hypothetical protein M427DRAFT_451854 [Gonapodya prolifera JEL478]|uniref:Uncharacterized protein n=1 Tax=Gonapodya prolifera (strain JEL478) TaxID=1344416 RepID=A0A139ARY1_GONPJ|nr:hypothetical protein M427DRAFT_451854 [Gonapodya prolifera JEL478]|eukprot:KXS19497.1 hypothetical protein M427DRAFT_451854 [Gonapodya prolifera JEL478]